MGKEEKYCLRNFNKWNIRNMLHDNQERKRYTTQGIEKERLDKFLSQKLENKSGKESTYW